MSTMTRQLLELGIRLISGYVFDSRSSLGLFKDNDRVMDCSTMVGVLD